MQEFEEKGYALVRDFINDSLSGFLYSYLHLKKKVFHTLRETKMISPYNLDWGSIGDTMVPGTFSLYGDTTMDALLTFVKEKVEKASDFKLDESYSYARLYKKDDVLYRHVDRQQCAVSITINLGGDVWPIYLIDKNNIQVDVSLKAGNALLYKGGELAHWRDPLEGEYCGQLFLHYVHKNKETKPYDTRLHLGLPASMNEEINTTNDKNIK